MLLRPGHRAGRAAAAAGVAVLLAAPGAALADGPHGDDHGGPGHHGQGHGHDRRPEITAGPTISGTPQVGSTLTATATWSGDEPIAAEWAWLRCASVEMDGCRAIPAATSATYVPVAADTGKRLRVRLTVSNDAGWSWKVPPATAPVAAPPPPVPAPPVAVPTPAPPTGALKDDEKEHRNHRLRRMHPRPVVRIKGWLTRTGAHVSRLTVNGPRRAHIQVHCRGRGCPRRRWSRTHRHRTLVHLDPFERSLRAGIRLTITVTRRGYVGKHTVIRVRRGRAPSRVDRCLRSSHVRRCSAA